VTGLFIAVVGPSGVGKDALLDHARALFSSDLRFVFPRRVITRDARLGGEIFDSVSRIEFDSLEQAGHFALSWRAHGLSYGLRQAVLDDVDCGKCVVANVSRGVLDQLGEKFGRAHVVHVTAAPEVSAGRLVARGRESGDELAGRVARFHEQIPPGLDVTTIDNGGALEIAQAAFARLLDGVSAQGRL
jgi:ribose 1,5-bisphosphokinase